MAPTELLAEQHWRSFNGLVPRSSAWTPRMAVPAARKRQHDREGVSVSYRRRQRVNSPIGTHALFQEGVDVQDSSALVVIDEQHRFGVHQRHGAERERHRTVDGHPHQLVMTATPIPRTLAMAAYADLDVPPSSMSCRPGRQAGHDRRDVPTRRVDDEIIERVRAACATGQQAYWVCPLIEESEVLDFEAAEAQLRDHCDRRAARPFALVSCTDG